MQRTARSVLWAEPVIMAGITVAFWYASPIRDRWLWLLGLLLPIYAARIVVSRRADPLGLAVLTMTGWFGLLLLSALVQGRAPADIPLPENLLPLVGVILVVLVLVAAFGRYLPETVAWLRPLTPLDGWIIALLALCVWNIVIAQATGSDAAPYTRGGIMLGRLTLGVAFVAYFSRVAYQRASVRALVVATTWLALLVGVLALGATQWNSKSEILLGIINVLPTISGFPGAETGFNGNEIAGALAWLLPVMTGLALYRWRASRQDAGRRDDVTIAAVLLALSLLLGQSRFAIGGVIVATALLVWLLIPGRVWRAALLSALAVVIVFQAALLTNILEPAPEGGGDSTDTAGLSQRDQNSITNRIDIWLSGIRMTIDHPLTGVGMSFYRYDPPRRQYPVPYYVENNLILPHAHNEWVQVGADLGFPGLIAYTGIQVMALLLLYRCWRHGRGERRALALAVGAGLLAHMAYGLGDAVTLWDRLIFVYWWLLALAAAVYVAEFTVPDAGGDFGPEQA